MINTGKTYKSLSEVLELLNSSYIKEGEEIRLKYRTSPNSVDLLVAIGTKTGIGPGCYSILGTASIPVVTFVTELPDSSNLKNGQLYIWTGSPDKIVYKVYLEDTTRVSVPVNPDMLVQDTSGAKYYVSSSTAKRLADLMEGGKVTFLRRAEYDELPEAIKLAPGNIFVICSKIQ